MSFQIWNIYSCSCTWNKQQYFMLSTRDKGRSRLDGSESDQRGRDECRLFLFYFLFAWVKLDFSAPVPLEMKVEGLSEARWQSASALCRLKVAIFSSEVMKYWISSAMSKHRLSPFFSPCTSRGSLKSGHCGDWAPVTFIHPMMQFMWSQAVLHCKDRSTFQLPQEGEYV